jgi:large subunit ribosomal protein L4
MEVDVLTLGAEKSGAASLKDDIFGLEPRKDLLHRYVVWQLAKRQQGTHATKERGDVRGSTRKIVRQKGSGGARHGSKKAPQFRGGGVAHGPRPRSHAIDLPKKVRKLALRHALSAKQGAGELIIIDEAKLGSPKTSELVGKLKHHGLKSALFMDGTFDENFAKAARNIQGVNVLPVAGANVYDILKHDKLVLTKAAVEGLEARLA